MDHQDDRIVETTDLVLAQGGAPSDAGKKTIEAWGEAKGIWPQTALPGTKPSAEYWKFAAARAHSGWQDGQVVTEAEFDEAVKAALSLVHR
jgi:hypothetical protein